MCHAAIRQIITEALVCVLLVVTPVLAQVSREWMVCSGKDPDAQPDRRVAACTAIIEAIGETLIQGTRMPTVIAASHMRQRERAREQRSTLIRQNS